VITETERTKATVQRILAASRELFMQHGYRAVSISDIVRAAGITKPTLYYHFADKEALYAAMALHVIEEMQHEMLTSVMRHPTTHARLVAIARMVFAMPDGDTRLMRHQIFEHLNDANRAQVAAAFWQGFFQPFTAVMAEGIARHDLHGNPFELAMLFSSLIEGAREWAMPPSTNTHAAMPSMPQLTPERIVDLFLYGVGGGRAKSEERRAKSEERRTCLN
jgi:AcrR family transcriptional regulator